MPISPSQSLKLSGTSNGSLLLNQLDHHHHRRPHLRLLLSTATPPLQNGVPSECAEVVAVYYVWTTRPLDSPYVMTNQCTTLDARRTARLRDRSSNVRAIGKFRGGFAIVGYSMQTTSLLLGMTVPMKRIGRSWTSSIPSASLLLRLLTLLTALLRYLFKGMGLCQENDHQRLTTDPQSMRRHPMAVFWGFCLIRASLRPFVATPSSLPPISSSLRHLPRPQRRSITGGNWRNRVLLEFHRRRGCLFLCSSR
jgi:hypothetical protein